MVRKVVGKISRELNRELNRETVDYKAASGLKSRSPQKVSSSSFDGLDVSYSDPEDF